MKCRVSKQAVCARARARTWLPFCVLAALLAAAGSRRWEPAVAVLAVFIAAFALMHLLRRCPYRGRSSTPSDAFDHGAAHS